MHIKTIKLRTMAKDRATGLEGMITHWICDLGHNIHYVFHPKGINPEDGMPIRSLLLEKERFENHSDLPLVSTDLPLEILGTVATDKASGFNGMMVCLVQHLNGCLHAEIQPAGVLAKTNSPIGRREFDLRQLEGEFIPRLDSAEEEKSRKDKPSPAGFDIEQRNIGGHTSRPE